MTLQALLSGRKYAMLGQPGSIGTVEYGGKEWVQLVCKQNDRPKGEKNPAVDRIGLDGWPQLFGSGEQRMDFTLLPRTGLIAKKPGDWTNLFELHASKVDGVGPFTISNEWSAGSKKAVARITVQGQQLATFEMKEGEPHPFEVRWKTGKDGFVWVKKHNIVLVDYKGPFAVGMSLYPQFRIYRNTRPETATLLLRVEE